MFARYQQALLHRRWLLLLAVLAVFTVRCLYFLPSGAYPVCRYALCGHIAFCIAMLVTPPSTFGPAEAAGAAPSGRAKSFQTYVFGIWRALIRGAVLALLTSFVPSLDVPLTPSTAAVTLLLVHRLKPQV
jgi:hypothetical protein